MFDQSWRISFLAVEGLRDVELSERDSHLFVVRCGYIRYSMSSRLRWSKKVSVEHMRRIRRERLNGLAFLCGLGGTMF